MIDQFSYISSRLFGGYRRRTVVAGGVVLVGLVVAVLSSGGGGVFAATTNLVPNGDQTTGWGGSSCSASHYTCVDEGASANTGDVVSTGTGGDGGDTEEYQLTTQSAVASASAVNINIHTRIATQNSDADTLTVQLIVDGSSVGSTTVNPTTSWSWQSTGNITGSWSQSQVDGMRVRIVRNELGGGNPNNRDDNVQLASVYATLDYISAITFEQSTYRWFNNNDSTDVGASLAAEDAATNATAEGTPFRLRTNVHLGSSSLASGAQSFKLQYAERSGSCDVGFSGESYQDVEPQLSATTALPTSNDTTGSGTSWSGAASIYASDDSDAQALIGNFETAEIIGEGFGFSLSGDEVVGIEVAIERTGTASGALTDSVIRLIDADGNQIGDNRAASTNWGASEVTEVYGGPTDMWSANLSGSDVSDADFGVLLEVYNDEAGVNVASVDSMSVTIYTRSVEPVTFYNNATPNNGAAMTSNLNDPTHNSDTNQYQTYVEQNNFTNSQSTISAGNDGVWDFVLVDNAAPELTTYCFRIVLSSGAQLTTYSVIPEITTLENELTQLDYKWFDTNSGTPAEVDSRGDQNTVDTLEFQQVSDIRLRLLLGADNKSLLSKALKLQYAPVGADGICDTSFTDETYQDFDSASGLSELQTATSNSGYTTRNDGDAVTKQLDTVKSVTFQGANFGFSVPVNATIAGIEAHVYHRQSANRAITTTATLTESGSNTYGLPAPPPNSQYAEQSAGGPSDMWGTSLSPADINSSTFGVDFNYSMTLGSPVDVTVDEIGLTIYYEVDASSGIFGYDIGGLSGDSALVIGNESPVNSTYTTVAQNYYESSTFDIDNNLAPAEAGLYDFSIRIFNKAGGRYCFRVVEDDGTLLDSYDYVPELYVSPQPGQALRHGGHFSESGVEGILY